MSDSTGLSVEAFGFHDEPMKASGLHHFIERDYRDTSSPFQWARETAINAIEAEASRILFGIEWQGVEARGVYRRYVADNGVGMKSGGRAKRGGLGTKLVDSFARQLGAKHEVTSSEAGTRHDIVIPKAA